MVRRADREPVALEAAAEAVLADSHDPYSPPNHRRPGARCYWSAGVEHSTLYELLVHLLRVVWRARRVAIVATALVAGVASFLARRLGCATPLHRRLLQTMHELEALQARWTWPTGPTRPSRPP